jgi:hypothetical protein
MCDSLQQPVPVQRRVRILGKHLEEVELAWRQRLFASILGINQPPLFEIEHATTHAYP